MSVDDPFPPIDPIVPMAGPPKVVARRRRFSEESRRLMNLLGQEQKELFGKGQKEPVEESEPEEPSPPPIGPGIDKFA